MEEEFYATVKLISGEEIVSKVVYLEDEDKVLLENPLQVQAAKQRKGQLEISGFSFSAVSYTHLTLPTTPYV